MVDTKISPNALYKGVAKTRVEQGEADWTRNNIETNSSLACHPYPCAKRFNRSFIEIRGKSSITIFQDLKYRMKALALYNGDLEESFYLSIASRKSKR